MTTHLQRDIREILSNQQNIIWTLLKIFLCFIVGIFLLYGTNSVANLLCLSFLVLAPHIDSAQGKKLIPWFIWVSILLIAENVIIIVTNSVTTITSGNVSPSTPFIILLILCGSGVYFINNKQAFRQPEFLPGFATFFLVIAVFDIIDRSFVSLILLIITIALIEALVHWKIRQYNSEAQLQEAVTHWLTPLRNLQEQPIIIIAIISITLFIISSGTNPLNSIFFTVLTILGCLLLFTTMYEFIPGDAGYLKAIIFPIPLMLIFIMGIATSEVPWLTRDSIYVSGRASSYALFLDQLPSLLIGRMIFYVSVPMLIGLYRDYKRQRENPDNGNLQEKFNSLFTFVSTLVSILVPSLYNLLSSSPAIITFSDLIQHVLRFTE